MRFALVDSGLGVLPTAAELRRNLPDATLILSMDPEGMPWGLKHPDAVVRRVALCSRAALRYEPDVLICASNTGSILALDALRAELGNTVPIVGNIPPLVAVASKTDPVAVWATVATSGSQGLAKLIDRHRRPEWVTRIACPGLAEAIETGDSAKVASGVCRALERTPESVQHLVLGCTQYELAVPWIAEARPKMRLYQAAHTTALEAMQCTLDSPPTRIRQSSVRGRLQVLLSGQEGTLPAAALSYEEGRTVIGESITMAQ